MKEKLKSHFLRLGPRRFVVLAILALIVTDVVNTYYMRLYWTAKDMSRLLVHRSIVQGGQMVEHFSPTTIREITDFVTNAFGFFLLIVLLNNFFFYFFYLRRRFWAQGFVLVYALTGALFQLTFIFDNPDLGTGWMTYNIACVPFYLYVFLGVKLLKLETTSPAGGKEAK
jgi:hypothetical protein